MVVSSQRPSSEPTLSVVVPTHDVGAYIDECLLSIARQAVGSIEVIVVDDHSSDDTAKRVVAVAATDARFRLVQSPERGGGFARNLGAQAASGRYIIFIDGDDIVPDGAFQALIDTLENTGSDMACGRYLKFSANRTWDPTQNWLVYKEVLRATTLDQHPSLIRGRACWNKMFRRDFWLSNSLTFPNVPRSNDILPMTQALARARSIDVIPEVVYLYRERPGSKSMTSRAAKSQGVLSYLEQELACFDELELLANASTVSTYVKMLYQADLWVHIARFVSQAASEEDSDAFRRVSSLVAAFLERTPSRTWRRDPTARRLYLTLVAEGQFSVLRGLDERGEIGAGPSEADGAAFAAVRETITVLSLRGDAFQAVIVRGLRHRIAEPMWALDLDGEDRDISALLVEIARLDAALPDAVRPLLTANERQLLSLSVSGDVAGTRDLIAALHQLAPSARPTWVGRRLFAISLQLPDDPAVTGVRLVGRNRDSGQEIAGSWFVVDERQHDLALTLDAKTWRARGVWLLEIDVRTTRIEYRRPVTATDPQPAEPSHRWASIRVSRVKRAGHHLVLVREPTLARRLAATLTARARRALGRR